MPVKPAEVAKCYGHWNSCRRRSDCPWSAPCMSRTMEEKTDIHFAEHVYMLCGDMFFDNGDSDDGESPKGALPFPDPPAEENPEEPLTVKLHGLTVTEQNRDEILAVLQHTSDLYFRKPKAFHALMLSVMKGMNQSDIAREEGVTRACVNKRLLHELGIQQKHNDIQERRDRELAAAKQRYEDEIEAVRVKDDFLRSLSARDWQIYKLVFVDGVSYRSAAKQIGCGLRTICRVATRLHSKMGENGNS